MTTSTSQSSVRSPPASAQAAGVNRCTYRVIYGDTDQMGIVYYANYLRFFERGRCEWLREFGIPYSDIEAAGFMLPVVDCHTKYKRPALFDDEIAIETELAASSRVRVTFRYRITRAAGGGDELLAEGTTTHACLNQAGRPVRATEVLKLLGRSSSPGDASPNS